MTVDESPTLGTPSAPAVLVCCALAGAGTMVVELAAVRLVGPWFGTSHVVWSNVIGVVLLALTLGYVLGGRLASGARPARSMGLAIAFAAVWVALMPWGANGVCLMFMPKGIALDQALGLFTWGSLAASLLLFLPASLLLGAVSPLATESLARGQHLSAGQAGGRVLATATVGSLVGVFGTSHWLLPVLGVHGTFLLAAVLLMVGATLLLCRTGSTPAALLWWLPLMGAGQLELNLPTVSPGDRVLGRADSAYQSIRVIETGEGSSLSRRLVVNEALDSFQSVWKPEPGLLGNGHYYDLFCLPLAWQEAPSAWNLLVLGLGAGTAVRVMEGVLPEGTNLVWTGVELDPSVVRLAQEFMDLVPSPPHRVLAGWDSRAALTQLPGPFDQIILDSYANNMEIPFHLATLEFFREALGKLVPGGWLSLNAAGFGVEDPLILSVASTMAAAAGREALLLEVPFSRNTLVYVRRDAHVPHPGDVLSGAPNTWGSLAPKVPGPIVQLLQSLGAPGTFALVQPGHRDEVLTDDRAPLEQMQRASIARGRVHWAGGNAP